MSQTYIDFAFVKQLASFERVLAHYGLALKGTGNSRRVLCPFHREREASCSIDFEKKIFHCFGCEAGGNILDFVALMEGDAENLRAAAIKLAAICEIPTAPLREGRKAPVRRGAPGAPRRGEPVVAHENASDEDAPVVAGQLGEPSLTKARFRGAAKPSRAGVSDVSAPAEPVNPALTFRLKLDPAHGYLAERGLSAEAVAEFGLGYCSRGVMAGRVCIPIHNDRGELVAYAGRWPGEDVPEGEDRYKLPGKFEKSRVLFNLHRVKDAEYVVAVEGYWSVFRLHTLGVPVVGLMGSSISAEQIALLRDRGTRQVTLLLDGDEPGRKARERVLPALASAFFVRAPVLPDGEKPDTVDEALLAEILRFPSA